MRELVNDAATLLLLAATGLFLFLVAGCRGTQGDEVNWGDPLYTFDAFTRDSIPLECRVHEGIRPVICNFAPDTTR